MICSQNERSVNDYPSNNSTVSYRIELNFILLRSKTHSHKSFMLSPENLYDYFGSGPDLEL